MTFEAQLVPGNRRYRVRTAEEDERAFSAAAQHSRLVEILRKALPIMAVLVFAAYFISTRLSITVGGVTASVSGIEVKDGNLRMVKPTLKGVDKKKGAYVISADYADQDMKNPKAGAAARHQRRGRHRPQGMVAGERRARAVQQRERAPRPAG